MAPWPIRTTRTSNRVPTQTGRTCPTSPGPMTKRNCFLHPFWRKCLSQRSCVPTAPEGFLLRKCQTTIALQIGRIPPPSSNGRGAERSSSPELPYATRQKEIPPEVDIARTKKRARYTAPVRLRKHRSQNSVSWKRQAR
jgi:hypothetical protein